MTGELASEQPTDPIPRWAAWATMGWAYVLPPRRIAVSSGICGAFLATLGVVGALGAQWGFVLVAAAMVAVCWIGAAAAIWLHREGC